MKPVLERNITTLRARRERSEAEAPFSARIADRITNFAGSMTSVVTHVVLFGGWMLAQTGLLPGVPSFDPTFVGLATLASVEGIFLTTFVLVSQNRQAALAEVRAELDLQIGLLAEHEVTRLTALVAAIADKLGVESEVDGELAEIEEDVAPEAVLNAIEAGQ